jgi:hypothetical protein
MYFAIARDDMVLSEHTLDAVMRLLRELHDGTDIAIWHGTQVVAIRHDDGRVTRFDAPDDTDDDEGIDLAALASGNSADDDLPF